MGLISTHTQDFISLYEEVLPTNERKQLSLSLSQIDFIQYDCVHVYPFSLKGKHWSVQARLKISIMICTMFSSPILLLMDT